MDPARGAGDTPGYVEDTGTPVVPSRTPTGASERGEGAMGQAPETANTATARAATIQTPKATGDAGTPRRDDKGSAIPVTTQEQQEGTGTKAEA